MHYKYLLILLLLVPGIFPIQVEAQMNEKDTLGTGNVSESAVDSLKTKTDSVAVLKISPFIELMGKGFISMNVDFRPKESYAISFGIQPLEGLLPNVMYYHFSGKRHRIEVGGGVSVGFSQEIKPVIVLVHGVIGYRYQKKKGLFFRAGFTPLLVHFLNDDDRATKFYPLAGLSLGYCF